MNILPGTGRGTAPAGRGGGGSPPSLRPETATARKLRRAMSPPEVMLWQQLRGGQAGARLRRQHPVGPYVVDFYCSARRLVIEVDGAIHDAEQRPVREVRREAFLNENGYRVVRVMAADILKDAVKVAASIGALVDSPLHRPADGPPPRAGEDMQ